jgi:DNA-binding MarR family transcriptional regulator
MDGQRDSIAGIERQVTLFLRRAESARRDEVIDRSAYLLLGELAARGPLGIGALAAAFQLDISTASRQAAALEAKGLVEREQDPTDGRVSLLRISPCGRRQLETTREARLALFGSLLGGWSEDDLRQFGTYLTRLNAAIVERRRRAEDERSPE